MFIPLDIFMRFIITNLVIIKQMIFDTILKSGSKNIIWPSRYWYKESLNMSLIIIVLIAAYGALYYVYKHLPMKY